MRKLFPLFLMLAVARYGFSQESEEHLIAALEINGWHISDATSVFETSEYCGVWFETVNEKLQQSALERRGDYAIFSKKSFVCSIDQRHVVMRLTLPKTYFRDAPLPLGDSSALDDAPTKGIRILPALALDTYISGRDRSFNATFSIDQLVLRAANLDFSAPANQRRYSAEYTADNRAQFVAGDVRIERGIVSTLDDLRGIWFSSVAPQLREPESLAEAVVAVDAPSRAFFLAENGQNFGETGLIPPGNYHLQGLPISTAPGQLEAVITDQDGRQQKILLPWSRSKRFIAEDKSIIEAYLGETRLPDLTLDSHLTGGVNYLHGLSSTETYQLAAEVTSNERLAGAELSTRRFPNVILTGGLGMECGIYCHSGYLFEGSWNVSKDLQFSGQMARWPDLIDSASYQTRQIGASFQARDATALSLSYGYTVQNDFISNATVLSLSNHFKTSAFKNDESWVLQLRKDGSTSPSGWGVYFELILGLDRFPNWTILPSTTASRGSPTQSAIGFSENPQGLYGMQLSGSASLNSQRDSSIFGRYQTPYGEVFEHADGSGRMTGGLASRLWITDGQAYLAPYTDSNLIIADVGMPGVHTSNAAGGGVTSDANGRLVLRRVPPWANTTIALDAEDMPININAGTLKLRLTTQLDHVYRVSFKNQWSASYSWQALRAGEPLGHDWKLTMQDGSPVFLGADGFVDLPKNVKLPITARKDTDTAYQCEMKPETDQTISIRKLLCDTPLH